jgi:putative spermidine/putrescine transport system permease protein
MGHYALKLLKRILICMTALYLLAPSLVIIFFSVQPSAYTAFSSGTFTLKWYEDAFAQHDLFIEPLIQSMVLGIASTAIATVLGTLAAFGLRRAKLRHSQAWEIVFLSPILLPTLIVGFGLMLMFLHAGLFGSWWGLLIGHVVIIMAYVTQSVNASLTGLDPAVEEAARTLGSSAVRSFFKVTLPQIMPGVITGAVFAFIISFDQLEVSLLLASPDTTTLPVAIYSYVQFDSGPTVAAIATILLAITLAFLLLLQRLNNMKKTITMEN